MADRERRHLLRATDDLLGLIEELRLRGVVRTPAPLRAQVAGIATEIGTHPETRVPATLAGAHDHVFRLQRGLLRSGNLRMPGREPASAATIVRQPSIPPRRVNDNEDAWQEQVRLSVQRAHDLARYLDAQAETAEALPAAEGEALAEVKRARAVDARQMFEHLARQAQRITGRTLSLDPAPRLPTSGRLEFEDLVIDLELQQVTHAGRSVSLTPAERRTLIVLIANPDRAVTREAMQHAVMGSGPTAEVGSRAMDAHMCSLRAKLGHPDYLETVAGVGYRAAATSAPSSTVDSEGPRAQHRAQRQAWARQASPSQPGPPPPVQRWTLRPGR